MHQMGNTNHYKDPDFMDHYLRLQKEFLAMETVYDVEDVALPLTTRGMAIVDRLGRRVKLAGGNWSGGHAKRHCVGGLDRRPLRELCRDIRHKFGMNCVRLTFSLELFRSNNFIPEKLISANPELFGKTSQQVFDETIRVLTEEGVMVILNNHTSVSQWCCSNSDGDGLWFNEAYSERDFQDCLTLLARRYRNNPRVIGIDLRNEVRKSHMGSPSWGDGKPTDWRQAAEKAGNSVLAEAPHWLVIVGGINYQLDLTGAGEHPVRLCQPRQLVYSGHFYGFSWGPQLLWSVMSEDWFREKIFNEQLFVRAIGEGVPFLVGEFGNNQRDQSWRYFLRLLQEADLDWTYWCLDGYKCDDQQDETFGVWDYRFQHPRHPELLQDMQRVARPRKRN